jgi:hypothetical protein
MTPLFTEKFCHPQAGSSMTYNNWYECPTNASESECPTYCAFTNGVELIPERDFCAPANITQNITAILECAGAN